MTPRLILDELIEKLIAAKMANAGVNNKRQLLFAKFDQHIHKLDEVHLRIH